MPTTIYTAYAVPHIDMQEIHDGGVAHLEVARSASLALAKLAASMAYSEDDEPEPPIPVLEADQSIEFWHGTYTICVASSTLEDE